MRIWTLQPKESLEVLDGEDWYCDVGYYKVRMIDEDYIKYDMEYKGRQIDAMPLTGFARVSRYNPGLSLRAFCSDLSWIIRSHECSNSGIVFELEVPESFILSMKPYDRMYQEYINMPNDTPRKERYKYLQVKNADLVVHENYKNHLRHKYRNESVEVIIPCIKKEHIVCYRNIEYIGKCYRIDTTICRPDAFPTFTESVYCGTDGYLRSDDESHKMLSLQESQSIIVFRSMKGCPRYYSLAEALSAVNEKTWKILNAKIVERNISKDRFDYVIVNDLFPEGLRL